MPKQSKTALTAQTIIDTAKNLGWSVSIRNEILTISKPITPSDLQSFAQADGEYDAILGLAPMTSAGSVWGTDGGGMGALHAMEYGTFTMNKSGVSKRVMKALEKALR